MTPEEAKALAAGYPEEIHFIGGPYCGAILKPGVEMITDVHRTMDQEQTVIPDGDLPINFFPADEDNIVLKGPLGYAWYRRGEDLRWTFLGWANVDDEQDVE